MERKDLDLKGLLIIFAVITLFPFWLSSLPYILCSSANYPTASKEARGKTKGCTILTSWHHKGKGKATKLEDL